MKADCYERRHMTPAEFAIWSYARQVSYRKKIFYLDGRKLAREFEGLSKTTVYRHINSLKKKGWLVQLKPYRRLRTGIYVCGQYRVLDHDAWLPSHPGTCPAMDCNQEEVRSELVTDRDVASPVAGTGEGATSAIGGTGESQVRDAPVRPAGHSSVIPPVCSPVAVAPVGALMPASSVTSTSVPTTSADAGDAATDAVAADAATQPQLENPSRDDMDFSTFMVGVQKVFEDADAAESLRTTQDHRERAFAMAKQHGVRVFLAALKEWLSNDHTADQLILGTRKTLSGVQENVLKTWVLKEFIDAGFGLAAIKRVAPYGGSATGEVLEFLVEHTIPPAGLTPTHYDALEWVERNHLMWDFTNAYEAGGGSVLDFTAFLTDAETHVRERCRERKRDFDAGLWRGYAPHRLALLALIRRLTTGIEPSAGVAGGPEDAPAVVEGRHEGMALISST